MFVDVIKLRIYYKWFLVVNKIKRINTERRDVFERRKIFIKNKEGLIKKEVVYNVTYSIKDNLIINDEDLKEILTKKLLRVIITIEDSDSMALKNS